MSFEMKAIWLMNRLLTEFRMLHELDVAAIAGNGGEESAGFADLTENNPRGGRGGLGWFQWTGPRRKTFEAWSKRMGLKTSSDEANYGFLAYELRTSYKVAITMLLGAATLDTKVKAFELAYEKAGVKHYDVRTRYARRALAAFKAAAKVPFQGTAPAPTIEVPRPDVPAPAYLPPAVEEPKPMVESLTIWGSIGTAVSSGAAMVLAYINSVYGLVAFALVLGFAYLIIRERLRHRKEDGV